jgi:phosphotransferase system HPr (HPr) family protein
MGLHARPSHAIVAMVSRVDAKVTLIVDGREADAMSILSVMALGATPGSEVLLAASGPDAESVLDRLVEFFKVGFEE